MAESSDSPDIDSIIASYSSTVDFELPGIGPVEYDSKIFKSGGRHKSTPFSLVEPTSRTVKVTHIDIAPFFSNAGVRGMVTNVSHGTFHFRPASLIAFSFSLRSGEHGFRFQSANIKITFSKHSSAAATDANPAIVKFAPRKIFGLPTIEGRRNRVGGELTLQVPAGPLTFGPTIRGERENEYEKEYRYKTIGNFWSSKQGTDWDIVYWDIKENKRTKDGIPDRINVGVVVEREGSFIATVEVEVTTPFMNGAFSYPWTKNSPASFVPGVVMGQQPRTRKFEQLTLDEWRALIPHEEEWENKFTESALHREEDRRSSMSQASTRASRPSTSSGWEGVDGSASIEVDIDTFEEEESDDR